LEGLGIFLERERSPSSESKISPSSERWAMQLDGRNGPIVGGLLKPTVIHRRRLLYLDRLKRAAEPSAIASEEAGGFED
jgi:hypothetical protein